MDLCEVTFRVLFKKAKGKTLPETQKLIYDELAWLGCVVEVDTVSVTRIPAKEVK